MKKKIGILFGGQSVEHDVSIITALQIFENIRQDIYNVELFYIDKSGNWYTGNKLGNLSIYKEWDKNKKKAKNFTPSLNKKDRKNFIAHVDVVIIASHGTTCEDGKLQGFLDLLELPYTSSGVVGSASGMDKIVMKKIFKGIDLPLLPYFWFNREEWYSTQKTVLEKIQATIEYPIFVKPANLGSSIGISMAKDEKELINAIEIAIQYDNRILIEKGVDNAVEVNLSVMKNKGTVMVSKMEEPLKWETFLSFDDKYIHSNQKSKNGMSGMSRKIPADISPELKSAIIGYSKKIYTTMDCNGVVRIDFLLDNNKSNVYVNEINTIPGSLSFYLWEPAGIKFRELIDIIIEEAQTYYKLKHENTYKFDSNLIDKFSNHGSKGSKI